MSVDFTRNRRNESPINLTPLIDVIFQLLVFFMLTSTFIYPSLPLDLPNAEVVNEAQTPQLFVLSLDKSDRLYLNQEEIPFEEVEDYLRMAFAEVESPVVHFRGDRELDYRHFITVMQAASRSGAAAFYLIHEEGEAP